MREAEEDGNGNKTNNSDNSILDEKPLRIFGHPLTITQQMWLGFVVPAGISTIIYIVNFALDIAVTYQLFRYVKGFLKNTCKIKLQSLVPKFENFLIQPSKTERDTNY